MMKVFTSTSALSFLSAGALAMEPAERDLIKERKTFLRGLNADLGFIEVSNLIEYLYTDSAETEAVATLLKKHGGSFHESMIKGKNQHVNAHSVKETPRIIEEFMRETQQQYSLHRAIRDGDAEKVKRLLFAKNKTKLHKMMKMSEKWEPNPSRDSLLPRDGLPPLDLIELAPLHIAVAAGRPEIVQLLLNEPKTNVNQVSTDDLHGRSTPLHYAVLNTGVPSHVRTAMVKLLLAPRPGAVGTPIDVNLRTASTNKTALELARDRGLHDIVELLTDHEAKQTK